MKNGGVHFSLPEVSTSRESRPKLTYPQVVSVFPSIFCRGSKSTNFQKSSTWYKIWVLGGTILCTPFAMRWNPQFWVKSGKLPAAATRCISEELLLSSSGQSGVNKSRWELLLQKCIGPSITKIPSEMEVAPRYNCWNCWYCWHCFGAKCGTGWMDGWWSGYPLDCYDY